MAKRKKEDQALALRGKTGQDAETLTEMWEGIPPEGILIIGANDPARKAARTLRELGLRYEIAINPGKDLLRTFERVNAKNLQTSLRLSVPTEMKIHGEGVHVKFPGTSLYVKAVIIAPYQRLQDLPLPKSERIIRLTYKTDTSPANIAALVGHKIVPQLTAPETNEEEVDSSGAGQPTLERLLPA